MTLRPAPFRGPLRLLVCLATLCALHRAVAQEGEPSVYVDERGVMRWSASDEELALFGVNYSTPFAHAFRAHKRRGVSWREAIDADAYHFARLGLDAYRIHVWDREISDREGNLVVSEHVRAFDYLLARLKERGIKIILTPLQFGNAAYPEDGVPLGGFSADYGKQGSLEDKRSWPLQARYLEQFVNHVNPHTGLAYKDDPDIIAFEICNEPGHFEYDLTLDYINTMVESIRGAGCRKPIFYNMSHGLPVFEAYLDAKVQGGTFQWYPANLVAGREQRGNFLPYVDNYPIPFADHPKFQSKAKMVYEFDAADIGRGYIYPAIARTYRKVGMQFATMFAYDPMRIAAFNTEYQTHYMNLAYAPQKGLGLMAAAEAFRRVARFEDFGRYPDNLEFAGVRVSYTEDLAEVVTAETLIHSNATDSTPPEPQSLSKIAGYGSSPIVDYPGYGAYFLDRLEPGVWRLEVMPDAVWVRDPFETPHPEKHVSRIAWNQWPMTIDLPGLGEGFSVRGLNAGNEQVMAAQGKTFTVAPGSYLLSGSGVASEWHAGSSWKNLTLGEFEAPAPSIDQSYVLHQPPVEAAAGSDLTIRATVVAREPLRSVELVAYLPPEPVGENEPEARTERQQPGGGNTPGVGRRDTGGAQRFPMKRVSGLEYEAILPGARLYAGSLRYHIVVDTSAGPRSFPAGLAGRPTDWHFYGDPWRTRVVSPGAPIVLFEAAADYRKVTSNERDVRYDLVPSDRPGIEAMEVATRKLPEEGGDHSFRFFFKDKVASRSEEIGKVDTLVVYGRSGLGRPSTVQFALVTSGGIAYGATAEMPSDFARVEIPVESLRQSRAPNIPHGYPSFIDFWSEAARSIPLDLSAAESLLVSVGPGLSDAEQGEVQGLQLERAWLE